MNGAWSCEETLRVAVLAGGDSAERQISLDSGENCVRALHEAGHDAELIDPKLVDLAGVAWHRFDVCLVALHGGAGEDGRIQERLDQLGVAYTGSGPLPCRLAMSKSAAKERFWQARVPTPDYQLVDASSADRLLDDVVDRLGLPLVVKPDSQGSSLGVAVVRTPDQLAPALRRASNYGDFLLLERHIAGREFTVGLIDRQPLPLIEILAPGGELFDFDAKYFSAETRYVCQPSLDGQTASRIIEAAIGAAKALGTRGLVRVDLMLDDRGRPWVLEVNAVPGLTSHSLVPLAAAHAGWNLSVLCDRLVRACLPARTLR